MALPILPFLPTLSLGKHMPLLGKILLRTKSSLFQPNNISPAQPAPAIPPFYCISPGFHIICAELHREGGLKCLQRESHQPQAEYCTKDCNYSFVDMSHMLTYHQIIYTDHARNQWLLHTEGGWIIIIKKDVKLLDFWLYIVVIFSTINM